MGAAQKVTCDVQGGRTCKVGGNLPPHPPESLPPKGKAFGRLIAAPTAHRKLVGAHSMRLPEYAPGALARHSQAQSWNRIDPEFLQTQGPVGPEGIASDHSDFARRKSSSIKQECVPRNGVRGKRPMGLGGAKRSRSPSDASPVAFWLLCRRGQSNSPPAGGEIPLQKTPFKANLSAQKKRPAPRTPVHQKDPPSPPAYGYTGRAQTRRPF